MFLRPVEAEIGTAQKSDGGEGPEPSLGGWGDLGDEVGHCDGAVLSGGTSADLWEGEKVWLGAHASAFEVGLNSSECGHAELGVFGGVLQEIISVVDDDLGEVACGVVVGQPCLVSVEHEHGGLDGLGGVDESGDWGALGGGGSVPERAV